MRQRGRREEPGLADADQVGDGDGVVSGTDGNGGALTEGVGSGTDGSGESEGLGSVEGDSDGDSLGLGSGVVHGGIGEADGSSDGSSKDGTMPLGSGVGTSKQVGAGSRHGVSPSSAPHVFPYGV